MERSLRFGLVGTGHWARVTHATALASTDGVEFAAVWGRNPAAAGALAEDFGVTAHTDLGEFLADVDAVAFSVPPDVQADIGARAAAAGRHLLLEKPLAASRVSADQLTDAITAAGVASVVFFTFRFQTEMREWLARIRGEGTWRGGSSLWLGSVLTEEDSPFATPWRRDKGGLWDLAPHAISVLWACLGPVAAVTAVPGQDDLTHLVLRHDTGATSTVTVTLSAPPAADEDFEVRIWGTAGRRTAPTDLDSPVPALRTALTELTACARSGQAHPCDARFGRDVVAVLDDAQRQLAAHPRR